MKPFLRALKGERQDVPPIWLMRQAGRYLPEYLATRKKAGSFLDLCYNSDLAIEVTLQPIRRFGFDAAILFSDILVVPHALGQNLWFEEGAGPKLTPLQSEADLDRLEPEPLLHKLSPIFETLKGLRRELPLDTALIGFAGAPWTVASYMVEGGSSRDFHVGKKWAYGNSQAFQKLIDLLVEATSRYLIAQVNAGAEALQLFDSWSGVWPEREFRRWCLEPAKAIVKKVKAVHPTVPIVLFPRGAGLLYQAVAEECGAEGLSLDTTVPLQWARETLQPQVTLQGNLDPVRLIIGGEQLDQAVDDILDGLGQGPMIFNLGHGIDKTTPPDHVTRLVERVRDRG
jgi:uroporphyrinogen decarboxylase|tara:strand:+ start:3160 stop:4185 length:1026 start_codon:yes stop_codon:yes gene_type:complete